MIGLPALPSQVVSGFLLCAGGDPRLEITARSLRLTCWVFVFGVVWGELGVCRPRLESTLALSLKQP